MTGIANDPENIRRMRQDAELRERVAALWRDIVKYRYVYNFNWMGRPIVQVPEDVVALQELIWKVKPELVIETGIAHGGGLVLYASVLHSLGGGGRVLGIDIDIREHNRRAIEAHPLTDRIQMIEGSSVAPDVLEQVRDIARNKAPVMVLLDSNHTHAHVLEELRAYSGLVRRGSYIVVMDTAIEDLPDDLYPDRPWSKIDNPKTAARQFLSENSRFRVDTEFEDKLLLSVCPEGYLLCVADET